MRQCLSTYNAQRLLVFLLILPMLYSSKDHIPRILSIPSEEQRLARLILVRILRALVLGTTAPQSCHMIMIMARVVSITLCDFSRWRMYRRTDVDCIVLLFLVVSLM